MDRMGPGHDTGLMLGCQAKMLEQGKDEVFQAEGDFISRNWRI